LGSFYISADFALYAVYLRGEAYLAARQGAAAGVLALWKNADPNIPVLTQAKAEYAKLK
jgi:hypothetical protein